MNLYVDLDETLVKTVFDHDVKRMTTPPVATIEFPDANRYVYLRPDLELLRGIPFAVFTSGSSAYATIISNILTDIGGLAIESVHSADDIDRAGYHTGGPGVPITRDRAFLIDDLRPTMSGIDAKRKALPAMVHCQVIPVVVNRLERRLGGPLEVSLSRDPDPEAHSLAECLEIWRQG